MKIEVQDGVLSVPENPTVLYIEGDGVGCEITPEMRRFTDAAVDKAYSGRRRIDWKEVLAGGKARDIAGESLPSETMDAIREYKVAIKGPLMTPVGKGARSLNVQLRQALDLYVCLRPVRYFQGVPSPVKHPEKVDMVVFRENTEDIYAGIEWKCGTEEVRKVIDFLQEEMGVSKIRFPETSSIGIKPVSIEGTERLVRAAIDYAIEHRRKSVTLVHKGNIMKFTEGGFREWGYSLARNEYHAGEIDGKVVIPTEDGVGIVIKDCICDAFLQNILIKPEDYDVVATLNLNGDYVSDAMAAEVGGIGIAPGANINYDSGVAIFEATHGTAPDIAGKNIVNPLSIMLSSEMMLRYMGWNEAASLMVDAVERTICNKTVTRDFFTLLEKEGETGGRCLGTHEFTDELIGNL